MYNVTLTTGVITLRPKHGNNGYYTIGVGSASVPIPSGTATIDIDMYMIADASGEPLIPSMPPQTRLRQSIGSEIEEIEVSYGTGTNIQTKTIKATKQYNGVVTKDKDFYYSPANCVASGYYVGSTPPHVPGLYPLYGRGLSGKSIALSYGYSGGESKWTWNISVSRDGSVHFTTNQEDNTDYVEEFTPFVELTDAYNAFVGTLDIDDSFAVEAMFGGSWGVPGGSGYVLLKSGDAIKVKSSSTEVFSFEFMPDVDKMLYLNPFLSKSEEFIYDAKNNTFVPLYSDGERDDIVCAWEIPRLGAPKMIYHYADGTYIYKHNGNEIPLAIEGAPFDFVEGKECDDYDGISIYAVYPGYVLKLVLGTGVDEVRVNNYSYQSNRHGDMIDLRLCSMPSGYTSSFRTWLNATYPPHSIEPCSVSYPCFVDNGGNICFGSFAITPAAPVVGGHIGDMSLLLFNYGGEVERLNEVREVQQLSYADNETYYADAITWGRNVKTTALMSRANQVVETITIPESYNINSDFEPTMGTTEDTKDTFCWADVRKG